MYQTGKKKHKALIVDDNTSILQLLISTLEEECQIQVAKRGKTAIVKAKEWNPDIILLDIMLPDINGYNVCQILKENKNTRNIPIIFMTGLSEEKDEAKGLAYGAADYITKPFVLSLAKARILNQLELKYQRDNLEYLVKEQTHLVELMQNNTIECIGSLAEYRSYETGAHIKRCKQYVKMLANKLKLHPIYNKDLDSKTIDLLEKVTPLHDIGKITIPESILFKAGKLDEEEYRIIKNHTIAGDKILQKIAGAELIDSYYFKLGREITLSHHEKWDGSGYPFGLEGFNIPLAGRIMAVADVYDALTSKRVYKEIYDHKSAIDIIVSEKEISFDPNIVDALVEIEKLFQKFSDEEHALN